MAKLFGILDLEQAVNAILQRKPYGGFITEKNPYGMVTGQPLDCIALS